MSISHALAAADNLSKSFSVLATKAAAGGPMAGSPYSAASSARSAAFGDTQDLSNAAKQYGALRDIPYTAIRPIAVKVASQEILLGHKPTSRKPEPGGKIRTKELKSTVSAGFDFRTRELAPPFMRKKLAEGMEPAEDHFLLDLFETPNPFMDGWSMRYCTAASIYATGDAYWWIQRGGPNDTSGPGVRGLWYFPKTWITPIHEPTPFFGFKVQPPNAPDNGDPMIVPYADMLHFRFIDPADPLKSLSPMQTQARAINTDDEIQKSQFASMRNSINPSVILRAGRLPPAPGQTGQGPLPNLTPEQRRALIDSIRLHYAGSMHYGDPIIVDGLIEGVEKFSMSPAEMAFPESSQLTKDRILHGLGTSAIVTGQSENANRAGSATAFEIFYDLVVNPILTLMSATFTARLSPLDAAAGRKLYIWIEEARAKDADLDLSKMQLLADNMAVTKNELREFAGLKKSDDPEADKLPKPPEPPPAGSPPGISSSKPRPGKPAVKPAPGGASGRKPARGEGPRK